MNSGSVTATAGPERYKIFEEEIHKKDPAMKIVGAGPAPELLRRRVWLGKR